MVVGIYRYISPAEVASVAKIAVFTRSQVHGDCVLGLRDYPGRLFSIKSHRRAVFKDGNAVELAGEFFWR